MESSRVGRDYIKKCFEWYIYYTIEHVQLEVHILVQKIQKSTPKSNSLRKKPKDSINIYNLLTVWTYLCVRRHSKYLKCALNFRLSLSDSARGARGGGEFGENAAIDPLAHQ